MSRTIVRAAEVARHLHFGRFLPDGRSYFEGHLMVVADLLFDAGASREMIAAGYLQDAVAVGTIALEEIEREFGVEVAALIGGLTDRWHCAASKSHLQSLELERLAAESAQVQTVKLADDLARLRGAELLEPAAREALLAEVSARVEHLVLADPQVRYQTHAELAQWTDSGRTLLRALAIMDLSADGRAH